MTRAEQRLAAVVAQVRRECASNLDVLAAVVATADDPDVLLYDEASAPTGQPERFAAGYAQNEVARRDLPGQQTSA